MDTQTYLIEQTQDQALEKPENSGSYYRSQLYTSSAGLNPLITASHPIFSILERIKSHNEKLDIPRVRANLAHELKAFEGHANIANYSPETIAITRYILSAIVDEAIIKQLQQSHETLDEFERFTPLEPNNIGAEQRFFQILSRLNKHPDQYLDLLELIYLCLSSGYEGKYRFQANGRVELDDLIDQLYMTVSPHRQHASKVFYKKSSVQFQQPKKPSNIGHRMITTSFILVLFALYASSNYMLDKRADALLQQNFPSISDSKHALKNLGNLNNSLGP